MEFNPWLSLSDRSLVTAYFNSLANVVSENLDKDLFSPIQKYGEAIASLDGIGGLDGGDEADPQHCRFPRHCLYRGLRQRLCGSPAVNYARYFTFAIEPDILRKESFEEWLK